jgi:hypothetical protein
MPKLHDHVAQQLAALPKMSVPELQALWKKTFGQDRPAYLRKDFLVRAIAYRIQENAYGGLNRAIHRRLLDLAKDIQAGTRNGLLDAPRIKPGTRFVREWGGDTHVVTVAEKGFEYRDKRYGSLSEIARAITRTRWSGPAFFGLKAPEARSGGHRRG